MSIRDRIQQGPTRAKVGGRTWVRTFPPAKRDVTLIHRDVMLVCKSDDVDSMVYIFPRKGRITALFVMAKDLSVEQFKLIPRLELITTDLDGKGSRVETILTSTVTKKDVDIKVEESTVCTLKVLSTPSDVRIVASVTLKVEHRRYNDAIQDSTQ